MSKTLAYVATLKDEVTPGMRKIGKEGEKTGTAISGGFSKAGLAIAGMAAVVGPALVKSLGDAQHSADVAAQTGAVIKSTGGAANVTSAQIGKLATAMMFKTGVDDEAIRTGANMLLTFTNIHNAAGKNNDIFSQSTKTVLDMTSAMNGGNVTEENMRKTSILVGKALNDPVKGLSALSRVGVSFTAQQKEQIKAMVASGNTMGAQKIILGELKKEFGGSAEAVATPFKKLKTSLGELSETIGGYLLPAATKLTNWGVRAVQWFTNLPGPIKNISLSLLGIVAVGVPIILVMAKITTAFKVLSEGVKAFGIASKLAALGNPWVLLAVAIAIVAVLIITHWKQILQWGKAAFNGVLDAAKTAWNWLKRNWPLLLAILTGPFGAATLLIIRNWNTIKTTAKTVLDFIKSAALIAWNAVGNFFKSMWNNILRPAIQGLWNTISGVFGFIINGAARAFGWIPKIGDQLRAGARSFNTFRDNVNAAINGVKGKTVSVSVAMTAGSNPYPGGISGRKAAGGGIRGPGGPTSDTAGLFALSDGEYVVRASSVRKYGLGFMHAVNAGHMAAGGGINIRANTPSANSIGTGIWGQLVKYVKSHFMASIGGGFGSGGSGGAGVQRWAGLVLQVLAMLGQSSSWLSTVLRRMNQESGGNPNAINLTDSNAQAGYPSQGLMQTIPQTFAAYAGPFRGLGITNPLASIYAGINYAIHTYGSLAALNRPGGYAMGGAVSFDSGSGMLRPGYSIAHNGTGRNEFLSTRGGGTTFIINVHSSPLARPADIGREVVGAIREYEKRAGKGWRS